MAPIFFINAATASILVRSMPSSFVGQKSMAEKLLHRRLADRFVVAGDRGGLRYGIGIRGVLHEAIGGDERGDDAAHRRRDCAASWSLRAT